SECVRPYLNHPMYPELVFQILDSFTDVDIDPEFRPNPGFLTADHWRHGFRRAGFEHTEVKPELDGIREIYPHFFTGAICGQCSNSPRGNRTNSAWKLGFQPDSADMLPACRP